MTPNAEIRILVVDDDPFFLRVLEKRFGAEGYRVHTAADGREGMKAIVATEPHLVISDWMMPEVDGLELCQSVKTGLRDGAPYFILLTAKGEINDRLLGLETGADDYLVKPCDHGELMARVRAGLRIVTLTQELRRTVADLQRASTVLAGAHAVEEHGIHGACPHCRRVKGEDGVWRPLEEHFEVRLAAGHAAPACPDCAESNGRKVA